MRPALRRAARRAVLLRRGAQGGSDPDPAARTTSLGDLRAARWGQLGASVAIAARRHPDRVGARRRARRADLRRARRPRQPAVPTRWRARASKAGDGVAILARNHRGFLDAIFGAAQGAARALILLNTDFAGPQIREVSEREGAELLIYDDEYARLRSTASSRRSGGCAPGPTSPATTRSRRSIAARRRRAAAQAGEHAQAHHPDERHDRHAEGRPARRAAVAASDRRRCCRKVAVPGAARRRRRRAAVPRARLRRTGCSRSALGVDAGPAAPLRPRGGRSSDLARTARPRSSSCR